MSNSTHRCEVVPVTLEKHPNADTLSIIRVYDSYTYVAKTEEWQTVKKAVFIPPDTLADTTHPAFSFLSAEKKLYEINGKKTHVRIKARKIRDVVSFGLLVKAPDDAVIGEDWQERLGVVHYDPEVHEPVQNATGGKTGVKFGGNEIAAAPNVHSTIYDLENFRKYAKTMFVEGELVWVSEKTHGENSRYVFCENKMHCASHYEWKREYPTMPNVEENCYKLFQKLSERRLSFDLVKEQINSLHAKLINFKPLQNQWWRVLRENPTIETFCRKYEGAVLYGEVYGKVKGFKYGCKPGELRFVAFDVFEDGAWWDPAKLMANCAECGVDVVPTITYNTPFHHDEILRMAEGPSILAELNGDTSPHIREGVVVQPMVGRAHAHIGRVKLKVVSAAYLEQK